MQKTEYEISVCLVCFFFFQAEDGIRDRSPSRGLGDVYKRQVLEVCWAFYRSSWHCFSSCLWWKTVVILPEWPLSWTNCCARSDFRVEVLYQCLSLIHISEPTRRTPISYAVFCLKKKKNTRMTHIHISETKKPLTSPSTEFTNAHYGAAIRIIKLAER